MGVHLLRVRTFALQISSAQFTLGILMT